MSAINNYFDYLYFTECETDDLLRSSLLIDGKKSLSIPIRSLGLLPGHPFNKEDRTIFIPEECKLIFGGLKSLKAEIVGLLPELKKDKIVGFGIKRMSWSEDAIAPWAFQYIRTKIFKNTALFEVEAVCKNPRSWITLTVEATSFKLELPTAINYQGITKIS